MAKRRANGEGSLRKRPNGTWELSIKEGYRPDGKPRRVSFYGKSQKEVKEKAAQYQANTDWRKYHLPEAFTELSNMWYLRHEKRVTPGTYEGYRYTLRLLQDYFGDEKVERILPMDVENMLNALDEEGRSQSAISGCRAMMHQIMGFAVANGLITKNPVDYAEKMRYSKPDKRGEAFSDEEVWLLMENLPNDKIGLSIRLMMFSGLRLQEMLALEPRHISEDGTKISVEQAVKLVKGTVTVGETKTRASVREILVPENVQHCAIVLRDTNKKYIWEVGKKDLPCNPSHFRKQFKNAVSAVDGVRMLPPKSCRHTFVSMMREVEVELSVLKTFTGHTQDKTVDRYTHVRNTERLAASAKLSAAFSLDKSSETV